MDGPRIQRSDASNEITRRRNALVMTGSRLILVGNLPAAAADAVQYGWPNSVAVDDIDQVLIALRGQPLAKALWLAQRDVYGSSDRRPYVMVGLPSICIQPNQEDSVKFLTDAYLDGIAHWSKVAQTSRSDEFRQNAKRFATFLAGDLQDFRQGLIRRRRP